MNLKTYKYNIFSLNNKQKIDWGKKKKKKIKGISGTCRIKEPIFTTISVPEGEETEYGLKKHLKIMTVNFRDLNGDIKINIQETE